MLNRTWSSEAGSVLSAGLMTLILVLSGCDYWPPALQAQIEQMQVEAQIATAERAKLQAQLTDAVRTKEELQVRLDEISRTNRDLSGRVSTLEQALASERGRAARSSHKPVSATAGTKPKHKAASPKKPVKSAPKHRRP